MNAQIYFDNASTTQPYREVIDKVTEILSGVYGNPSSTHSLGRMAKSFIENARKNIAKKLGVQASEIVFTSGGTEANNLILRSCVRDLEVKVVVTSKIEHHAVLHTLEKLQTEYSFDIQYVNVNKQGDVDLQHLQEILQGVQNQNVLVSLMHVNNEIGNILPLKKVACLCKTYKAYFHSDTVQSMGHFKLDFGKIPIDFATASAHKFHGIKGVGFVYARKGIGLQSSVFGGEQERGLRSGTEPLHGIVAMETAFLQSYDEIEKKIRQLKELKEYFLNRFSTTFPEIQFNGQSGNLEKSSHTIVNVAFPFLKNKADVLLFYLDLKGIACSKGSACQSGSVQDSHVLSAFLSEDELKIPSLRFSFSHFNTKKEIDALIEIIQEIN